MQRHQQWIENRQYQHHLDCLMRIRQNSNLKKTMNKTIRMKKIQSANNARKRVLENSSRNSGDLHLLMDSQIICQQNQRLKRHKNQSMNSSDKKHELTLKQKQLLFNNFLLGKRIIQTPSVINFKKHRQNYQMHKKILGTRNYRVKEFNRNVTFRQQKLKKYAINNQRMNNYLKFKLSKKFHKCKNVVCLTLDNFRPLKPLKNGQNYLPIDDFRIRMKHEPLTCSSKGQDSEIINIVSIQGYQFYFGLRSKKWRTQRMSQNKQNKFQDGHIKQKDSKQFQNRLFFDILEVKGIDQALFGIFELNLSQFGNAQQKFTTSVQKNGKRICEVSGFFRVDLRKNIILQNE